MLPTLGATICILPDTLASESLDSLLLVVEDLLKLP